MENDQGGGGQECHSRGDQNGTLCSRNIKAEREIIKVAEILEGVGRVGQTLMHTIPISAHITDKMGGGVSKAWFLIRSSFKLRTDFERAIPNPPKGSFM